MLKLNDGLAHSSFSKLDKMIIWLITLVYDSIRAAKERRETKAAKKDRPVAKPQKPAQRRSSELEMEMPEIVMNDERPVQRTLRNHGSWQKLN
jgi:hypothetical protein